MIVTITCGLRLAANASFASRDALLLSLAARACTEGVRLGHRIGAAEPWAALTPVVAAPWALRALLGRLPEEAIFYLEEHFARKLVEQHRLMAREMIGLAEEKGLPHAALDVIADRL